MALVITHAFVSGIANDPVAVAAGEVVPSNWDAPHVVVGTSDITIGTSAITGGVNHGVLFNNGGIIGADSGFTYAGSGGLLTLTGGQLNATSTWQFDVGGTNKLDFGVTAGGVWTFATEAGSVGALGSFPGFYAGITGEAQARGFFGVITSNNVPGFECGPGGGSTQDIGIMRDNVGIFAIGVSNAPTTAAGLRVYNTADSFGPGVTNYERGVFDWTTTPNVLTIGTQKGGSGSSRNLQFVVGNTDVLDYGVSKSGSWTNQAGASIYSYYFNPTAPSGGNIPGVYVGLTTDANSRIFFALDGSENPYAALGPGNMAGDIFLNRQAAGIFGIGTSTTNASGIVKALDYVATGDSGAGTASANTFSGANSTTISTGTGTVKMSSANNANNTGWLKCYIGTQVAWIPCWTTNAP